MESTLELTKCGSGLSWKKLGKMLNDERPTLKVGKSSLKGFSGVSAVKKPPAVQEQKEMQVPPLDQEEPLEQEMATHSSILAWRIPRTEEPGGVQSMGSQRIRRDWSNLAHTHKAGLKSGRKPGGRVGGHKRWERGSRDRPLDLSQVTWPRCS